MYCKRIAAVALLASTASAQTFYDVIQQQPTLSLFATIIKNFNTTFNEIISSISASELRTILVPNNEAVASYLRQSNIRSAAQISSEVVRPFLSYHVLMNNVSSKDFSQPGGSIVESALKDPEFALLKDNAGQVVFAHKAVEAAQQAKDAAVEVKSGIGESVRIVQSNIQFDQGQFHVVDGLLTLPINCSKTIARRGAERLVTYIGRVNLLDALDGTPGATCFAPSDAAIESALPVLMNLTDAELVDAIKFHTLLDPYYTKDLTDGQLVETALAGRSVRVNIVGEDYYFNGVKAITTNDIVRNGVAYVLDGQRSAKEHDNNKECHVDKYRYEHKYGVRGDGHLSREHCDRRRRKWHYLYANCKWHTEWCR
ncbi:hypothetical protein Dda_2181 [Drechslerella dactyloides]|uniref:FAS1 domain-containing protein n=1 Tax=Drechslerella dactyloides TaxID=74499 RepID=A0AAD6J377_DREDA|nr:hypothetical protein Dda_2181 [Drechslerella dactyloides]